MQEQESVYIYRTNKDYITLDTNYCYGVLDGKNFLVMRETRRDDEVYIRWQKNQAIRFNGKNVVGLRAEKLLKLVLSKLQDNETTHLLIQQLNTMIEKNKKASLLLEADNQKKEESVAPAKTEEQLKQARQFKDFMSKKDFFAAKNEERKKAKEAERAAKAAQKEEEKRQRIEKAQQQLQEQRLLKELKTLNETYSKMVFNAKDQLPTVIQTEKASIILGHLDKKFYRIKIEDNNSSFYTVNNNKLEPMDANSLQKILLSIDENLNQNNEFDLLLVNAVQNFGEFTKTATEKQKNTLKETIAISKNILIQKGLLNKENIRD